MQSARYAQPRPPQVTISSTSMKNRSHCIVARVLIIGLSQKCAKSCRLHLTSCNDTVAQHLSHSCRAHPVSGYESYGACWTYTHTPTHQSMLLQAQIRPASADTNNSTHHSASCANATLEGSALQEMAVSLRRLASARRGEAITVA